MLEMFTYWRFGELVPCDLKEGDFDCMEMSMPICTLPACVEAFVVRTTDKCHTKIPDSW